MTIAIHGTSLPEAFVERMKRLLGDSFEDYLKSFDSPRVAGLRVNTDKITSDALQALAPFELVPIPWTNDGFYVSAEERPAKHPLFHAGLYYLQEPSAMAPAEVLNPQKGDFVLDVCSAPGGKTLQLANRVGDSGVVVSNDISASRLKAVLRNVEQFGLKNVIITCSDIQEFGPKQQDFYDAVLMDAPCSGEGMFRKDTSMTSYWNENSPLEYQVIQMRLIDHADTVLKPGGRLVYSTCTFSAEENEAVIAAGLEAHPHWNTLDIGRESGPGHDFSSFAPGIALEGDQRLERTRRLYPFRLQGEGHFVGLVESGDSQGAQKAPCVSGASYYERQIHPAPKALTEFMAEVLLSPENDEDFRLWGNYRIHSDKVMLEPVAVPDLQGVRVLRRGWYLGDLNKDRFEPAPSFAMGLKKHQIKNHITLGLDDIALIKYLKCETLTVDKPNGWYVVCLEDYPLGWAKVMGGQLKNKYPAAWRML